MKIDKSLSVRYWYCDIPSQNKLLDTKMTYIFFHSVFSSLNVTRAVDLFIKASKSYDKMTLSDYMGDVFTFATQNIFSGHILYIQAYSDTLHRLHFPRSQSKIIPPLQPWKMHLPASHCISIPVLLSEIPGLFLDPFQGKRLWSIVILCLSPQIKLCAGECWNSLYSIGYGRFGPG